MPLATASAPPTRRLSSWSPGPGVAFALAVAAVSLLASRVLPGVSALIIAIILGIVMANLSALPAVLSPGLSFAAKKLLRAGIVLLGLQVVLGDLLALGAPMLVVVAVVVIGGLLGTLAIGRALGVERGLTTLVACGFSICGAAAVAAAAGVTDPEDEHEERTVTAIALVVLCGTVMIVAVPALAALLDLAPPGPPGSGPGARSMRSPRWWRPVAPSARRRSPSPSSSSSPEC